MTPPANETDDITELFRTLGQPLRMGILLALVAGERGVGELAQQSGIAQPALSQQLALLRKAELVVTRREAKQVFYSLNPVTLQIVRGVLDELCSAAAEKHTAVPTSASHGPVGAAMFARVQARS
ncbi:MAG: metalloregulator ArsR/SmtB family transcription factor [Novosphingobium sp.]